MSCDNDNFCSDLETFPRVIVAEKDLTPEEHIRTSGKSSTL